METDVRKHLRGMRILVTLSLLAACLSFVFSYVLFKDVSVPLERMRTQEIQALQAKVDSLSVSRWDAGRMDLELQTAIHSMKEIQGHPSSAVQEQAAKALEESRTLLELMRGQ